MPRRTGRSTSGSRVRVEQPGAELLSEEARPHPGCHERGRQRRDDALAQDTPKRPRPVSCPSTSRMRAETGQESRPHETIPLGAPERATLPYSEEDLGRPKARPAPWAETERPPPLLRDDSDAPTVQPAWPVLPPVLEFDASDLPRPVTTGLLPPATSAKGRAAVSGVVPAVGRPKASSSSSAWDSVVAKAASEAGVDDEPDSKCQTGRSR